MNKSRENLKSGFSKFNERLFSEKEISGIGRIGTVKLLKGNVAKVLNFIANMFSYTSTRAYGFFLLAFGFSSLFTQLAQHYFVAEYRTTVLSLIIGASITLLSVPFLVFDKPIALAMQDNAITDYLFFEFLLIKRAHRNYNGITVPHLVAILFGVALSALTLVLPLQYIIIFGLLIILSLFALATPEFAMIVMLLFIPYVSFFSSRTDLIFVISAAILLVSFFTKVVVGKRVFNLDIYSILTFLAIIFIIISGATAGGAALNKALVISLLLLASVAISNLIVNRRIADCSVKAIVFSSIPVSILSVIEYIIENPWRQGDSLSDGVAVFFSFPIALSAFLTVTAFLSLTLFLEKKLKYKKVFYFATSTVEFLILIMLMQPSVWLAIILAAVSGMVLIYKKLPYDLLFIVSFIPIAILLIPAEILDTVSDIFHITPSFSEKLSGYSESFGSFCENLFLGVGRGGAETVNTPLGVGLEFGAVVLFVFVLMLILRFRHLFYCRHYIRNSLTYTSTNTATVSLVALVSMGFDAYIFADASILLLFSVIFAIGTSTVRIARREYNDRFEYYGDSRSSESSAVDISISKNF